MRLRGKEAGKARQRRVREFGALHEGNPAPDHVKACSDAAAPPSTLATTKVFAACCLLRERGGVRLRGTEGVLRRFDELRFGRTCFFFLGNQSHWAPCLALISPSCMYVGSETKKGERAQREICPSIVLILPEMVGYRP